MITFLNQFKENPNASTELPRMCDKENQLNYIALMNFYRTREELEKDITDLVSNCTKLHTIAERISDR
jgi:hypothetical protein